MNGETAHLIVWALTWLLLALLYGPAARCKPKMSLEKVGLALLYPAY